MLQDASALKRSFVSLEINNFQKSIEIGNELNSHGRHKDALYFLRNAFEINPQSGHVLLRMLETQLMDGAEVSPKDVEALRSIDNGFARFFEAQRARSAGKSPKEVLEILGDAFEAFYPGSEVDWLYLRNVMKILPNPPLPDLIDDVPTNLFFYWDKPDPPEEVAANFQYHTDFGIFDVKIFSKESATEFLHNYYGEDTTALFRRMRHPAEEADFVRLHLVYAFGGYYLDADSQVVSVERFRSQFGNSVSDVYVLSPTGPVYNGFFGAKRHSPVIAEAIRILTHNCYLRPDLSIWLKTGPGPITRALLRTYYLHLSRGEALPEFHLLDTVAFPNAFRAVPVSYRGDARDWRVFEAQSNK